ncbi:hypothetical protein D9619_012028 [Psilocybe cf. subviscida]|uniref:Aldehyde dehydrogenase domain-containing protein n=1 Tax=Psilocybe cf. subviscida TaxID=2480587 RepID=A0A8H5B7N5_9AGAR|nr:hypothetical protein D9619_012028 [Psilocybe cf. subviscida]
MAPLCGAIGAGCCALIKPSEVAPHSVTFIYDNLGKYLDTNCFKVVLGEVPEITKVLELKWHHICYTGNGRIARVISHAAAEHLTPLTLELGGKSPVILHASPDLEMFGPILPIMAVDSVQDAINYVNSQDHALVVYGFATNESVKKQIIDHTTSGGVTFSDTFGYLALGELPFGGVGKSGHGRRFLKYSVWSQYSE